MMRPELQNLFELESLEPRVLLSGDGLLAVGPVCVADTISSLPDNSLPGSDIQDVVTVFADDANYDQSYREFFHYDSSGELSDIFAGLTVEDAEPLSGLANEDETSLPGRYGDDGSLSGEESLEAEAGEFKELLSKSDGPEEDIVAALYEILNPRLEEPPDHFSHSGSIPPAGKATPKILFNIFNILRILI